MTTTANTQRLKGIRCPECGETRRFGVQVMMNITVADDGFDFMSRQPDDDAFPGRIPDEDDGFADHDPIVCMNGYCRHTGTIGEFRLGW